MNLSSIFRIGTLAVLLTLSSATLTHAQNASITTVHSDAFLGTQIDADFWNSAGSTTQSGSELIVKGSGSYGVNGVASKAAYSRASGDLILDTDLVVSNCNATGTTAAFGYGDVNPFSSTSGDYIAAIASGTLVLQSYQNGVLQHQVSTGYVCSSNAPFHIKLVALKAGGAKLFVNGSSTTAANTADGTFASKQIFLQAYQAGATVSYSNFFFSFLPAPTVGTGGTSGTTGTTGGTNGTTGTTNTNGTSGQTRGTTVLVGGGSRLVAGSGITAGPTQIQSVDPSTVSGVSATSPTAANSAGSASGGSSGASAQTTSSGPTGLIPCGYAGAPDGVQCSFKALADLAQNVIDLLIKLSVLIATVMIAYAGFLYLTSAGDSGKASKATKIFTNVVVGFIIVLAAWIIVHTVLAALLGSASPV